MNMTDITPAAVKETVRTATSTKGTPVQITSVVIEDSQTWQCVDKCPEGWVIVDTYNPCPSTTPWDYYGMCHVREYSAAILNRTGVESVQLHTARRILHPIGSGTGGSVRFGDDMLPGAYCIAVPSDCYEHAIAAIEDHREQVQAWLDGKRDMPEECRQ